MHLRPADQLDADLLGRLLLEAMNWTGTARFTLEDVLGSPNLSHYIAGWPLPTDFGMVAVGEEDVSLGAAWARVFTSDSPGYGFVSEDVPELGMAVNPGSRRRGVGRALLSALIDQARGRDCPALSLSVEDGNGAARTLYLSHGFRVVGRNGSSDTMQLDL